MPATEMLLLPPLESVSNWETNLANQIWVKPPVETGCARGGTREAPDGALGHNLANRSLAKASSLNWVCRKRCRRRAGVARDSVRRHLDEDHGPRTPLPGRKTYPTCRGCRSRERRKTTPVGLAGRGLSQNGHDGDLTLPSTGQAQRRLLLSNNACLLIAIAVLRPGPTPRPSFQAARPLSRWRASPGECHGPTCQRRGHYPAWLQPTSRGVCGPTRLG